ncbi:hypothetical protein BpHYR1_021451 [Brachionus plicatilis]|uniref:Ubiquitin-like protease family profile domain-containing protein n=1 Tax=Brachionus plicatilis TaxID=10195 RepID=A0A3M7SUD3_BRAPC|nr:hypothetical protein BpHYR1_021451 [Brachionus plicatilis]
MGVNISLFKKIKQASKISGRFVFKTIQVEAQTGGIDCGIFAIAYAFDLCRNLDPYSPRILVKFPSSHLDHIREYKTYLYNIALFQCYFNIGYIFQHFKSI